MRKLRLAIEALGVKHGGGATVLSDLLEAAVRDIRFESIFVFCSPRESRQFSFPDSPRIVEIECPLAEGNKLYRLWWLERRLRGRLQELRCDVLLCLSGCGKGGRVPHLTMIQQSLPFSPEVLRLAGAMERLRLRTIRAAMNRSCRSSRRVLVQTHTMKDVVARTLSLPVERIGVVTPCVRKLAVPETPCAALAAMRNARPGFRLLYVGNGDSYKNVPLFLAAADKLRARLPELRVFLTRPTSDPANRPPGVVCVGYLSAGELAEAHSLADIFVMPSLQETVGLPLLEAMSAGTAIVAADRPYAREICGTAAEFFDPLDSASLEACLDLVLANADLRMRMVAEGHRLAEARRRNRPYEQILDEAAIVAHQGCG